jgi:molecular chaperone GrpE
MRNSTKWVKGAHSPPKVQAARDKASPSAGSSDEPVKSMPQQNAANTPPERQDDTSGTAAENVAALQSGTSDATTTREDLEDRLLGALAEQANIHERASREIDRAAKFASSQFAGDLLDTVDNLRLAVASIPEAASADPGIKPLIAGIVATERALMSALAKHGIVPINALDQPFDPVFHEAIHLVVDKDRPSETVIEVIKPGYMHHDRLLRPAAVRVTTAPESDEGR